MLTRAMTDSENTFHVYPVNDLIEHETDGEPCVCNPTTVPIEREDGSMAWQVIHHSLDGRELSEPDFEPH